MITIRNKLYKSVDDTVSFTIDLTNFLNSGELISSIISIVPSSIDFLINSFVVNSSIVTVSNTIINPYKSISISISNGLDNSEYYITWQIRTTLGNIIEFTVIFFVSEIRTFYYGSIAYGNKYFSLRLRNDIWLNSTIEQRLQSLIQSTQIIEQLRFKNLKTDINQPLSFPRNGDTITPISIENATYEIAYRLLDDYDPDLETENLSANHHSYSSARSTYDRSFVLDHLRAGIPSVIAWGLIKPYLHDPNEMFLSRVN